MLKKRIIPTLLIKNGSIVKTEKFKNARIVGDIKSTIQVFSSRLADEICIVDIEARKNNDINFELVRNVAKLSNMPLTYGGNIHSLSNAKDLYKSGVDKLMLRTLLFNNIYEVKKISEWFGYQSIIACLDYTHVGKNALCVFGADNNISNVFLIDFVSRLAEIGIGEIFLNSVDKDGTMLGYDIETLKIICSTTQIPIIVSGGCGSLEDAELAFKSGASAIAAGSLFFWIGESIISLKQHLNNKNIPVRLK